MVGVTVFVGVIVGVTGVVVGTGLTISPVSGVGTVTISLTGSGGGTAAAYPFTTPGFSMPI